ncbi:DUF421 domain-containing protein [Aquibacillus saliphilus]|uniref:DUF421 domain-containing protein n=1 Tax=Aquibacillus saliphilus TaxID=1909422 RepID=UPI001CEFB2B5|nr:DUF421 domain-containing protein [Aquibacillus saliphilus]
MEFNEMALRTVITFVTLYILARILGKKLIAQMTFFDFVAGVSLGSIVSGIMFSSNITKTVGLFGLVIFALLALLVDFISLKSFKGRKILNDEPTLVFKDGKVYEEGMSKARLTMDELLFQLRKKKIFYLDEIDFAFFETDGSVSAMKKKKQLPPTKQELQINTASRGVPQTFIIDGKLLSNSLKAAGKDEKWVQSILQTNGILKVADVAIAQIDEQNKVYIDKRHDK